MPEHLESRERVTCELSAPETGLSADKMLQVCYSPWPLPGPQDLIAPATLLLARLTLDGHTLNTEYGQALKNQGEL